MIVCSSRFIDESGCIIIQREASELLFLLLWAMREPRKAGRATGTGFHAFIFTNQSDFGKPIGHDGTIMKQNKNEELQSRRQFFKSATKTVLLIIGAIITANIPLISKTNKPEMECYCYGCVGGCQGDCLYSCRTGCYTTCTGSCSGNCLNICLVTCSGSCSNMNY